jgi:hypothetical protein
MLRLAGARRRGGGRPRFRNACGTPRRRREIARKTARERGERDWREADASPFRDDARRSGVAFKDSSARRARTRATREAGLDDASLDSAMGATSLERGNRA